MEKIIMDYVLANLRLGNRKQLEKYKVVLTKTRLFQDVDTSNYSSYDASTLLSDDEWFCISSFSEKTFSIDLIRKKFENASFSLINEASFQKINYLVSVHDTGDLYFQNITKSQLITRKFISFDRELKFTSQPKKYIAVHENPDAIYNATEDALYFRNLSSITGIFPGIDALHREATKEEVQKFLRLDFIQQDSSMNVEAVSQPNRKRIALALKKWDAIEEEDQKRIILGDIRNYCPRICNEDLTFRVQSDKDLTYLLYGLDQRFYTTTVGEERRIANSIITIRPQNDNSDQIA